MAGFIHLDDEDVGMIVEALADRFGVDVDLDPPADGRSGALVKRIKELRGERSERDRKIVDMAHDECHVDGETEVDDDAIVSEGDDNGAYVQAWVWVSFAGTPFDKDAEDAEQSDEIVEEAG